MGDVLDYIEKRQEKEMTQIGEIGRQINEKDTPQKKLSRDNNLMLETGEYSSSNHRLYKYDLNFKQFFKTISEIVNK